jgi:hypothetical protein
VYASCRLDWWNKKLACIGKVTKTSGFASGTRVVLIMLISLGYLVFVNNGAKDDVY